MEMIVKPGGDIRCVYDETVDLAAVGNLHVKRASHVEPDAHGRWTADLEPVDGPTLGPFTLRSEALAAEQRWLEQHWLTRSNLPR